MAFTGTGQPLLEQDLLSAAARLGMGQADGVPMVWTLLQVESRGFGYSRTRLPKILFERHVFFRETAGRFARAAPDLCAKSGGGYLGGDAEFTRLERAIVLCRDAGLSPRLALRSASWGLGQVMGFNAVAAGFQDVDTMVAAMRESEGAQLEGALDFIVHEKLDAKLRARNWTGFARAYNGRDYWKNQYDLKLAAAFEKFSSGITRDLRARAAQGALLYLGYSPGEPDGVVGQNTRRAVVAFRKDKGLGTSEQLDDQVFDTIMSAAGLVWI